MNKRQGCVGSFRGLGPVLRVGNAGCSGQNAWWVDRLRCWVRVGALSSDHTWQFEMPWMMKKGTPLTPLPPRSRVVESAPNLHRGAHAAHPVARRGLPRLASVGIVGERRAWGPM